MRKIPGIVAVMVLGTALATPVLADHHGHYRGHSGHYVHGGYHAAYYAPYYAPHYYAPYPGPAYRPSLYFGFGVPYYAPAPAYAYAPAPVVAQPYGCYRPVWVPGHYAYGGGARFYVAGYWSSDRDARRPGI
jgi:hypothetical protein